MLAIVRPRHEENLRTDMKNIADLYKANNYNRAIVDLYNEMEDFIDAKKVITFEAEVKEGDGASARKKVRAH